VAIKQIPLSLGLASMSGTWEPDEQDGWHSRSRSAILAAMTDLARTADVIDPCEEEW
jgi:hypothetical protein